MLPEHVASARVGRLATADREGRPHIVPVCFVVDGSRWSWAVDHKPKATDALRRLANLRVRPECSLLVDHYAEDWTQLWWVRIDGNARVVEPSDPRHHAIIELLVAKYPQYRDAPPVGPAVEVTIAGWRKWSYTPCEGVPCEGSP